jgi:hypothetical protein
MQGTRLVTAVAGVATAFAFAAPVSAQMLDSSVVSAFRWRNVGPSNFMGRLSDVQGIPSPSKTIYIAAASGGVWKSINNGQTWRPLMDDKEVSSMGMLAIAPTDTNVIWAGTGEPNSRNTIEPGAGVYKSTNGGGTWTFMGLRETQHIGRIQIDPRNANVVYVAALGPAWKGRRRSRSLQDDRRRRDLEADQRQAQTIKPAPSTSRSTRRIPTCCISRCGSAIARRIR